jgi:hypothetical protein
VEDLVKELLSFIEAMQSGGRIRQRSAANWQTVFRQTKRRNGICCALFTGSERKLTGNW